MLERHDNGHVGQREVVEGRAKTVCGGLAEMPYSNYTEPPNSIREMSQTHIRSEYLYLL